MTHKPTNEGPTISVTVQCHGCAHLRAQYYCVEDGNDCDWGYNYSCGRVEPSRSVQPSATPDWCPLHPAKGLVR